MNKLHPIAAKHGYKSNADFYKDYPDETAYMKAGGSLSGAPHNGQPDAKEFYNFGYIPSGPKFFYPDGGAKDNTRVAQPVIPNQKYYTPEQYKIAQSILARSKKANRYANPYDVEDALDYSNNARLTGIGIYEPNMTNEERLANDAIQRGEQSYLKDYFKQDGGDTKNYLDQFKPKNKKDKAIKYDGESQEEYLSNMRNSFKDMLAKNTTAALHEEVVESLLNPEQEANELSEEYATGGQRRRNPLDYLFNNQAGWSYGQSQGQPFMMNSNQTYNSQYTGSNLKDIDFSKVDPRGVKVDVHKAGLLNRLGIAGPKSYSVSFGNEYGPMNNSVPTITSSTSPFDTMMGNQPHGFDFANPNKPMRAPLPAEQGARRFYDPNQPTEFAYGGYIPKAQNGAFDGQYGLTNQNVPAFPGSSTPQTELNPNQVVQPNMALSGNMSNGNWTPNTSTASGRFDFNRGNMLSGETKANMLLAGTAGAANFFGMDEQRAYEEKLASMYGADQQFYANTQHNRGTWSDGAQGPNINFRPNQHNPVQFSGMTPTEYMKMGGQPCYECGGMYDVGGEIEMSDEDLQNFLARGGQVEYL